MKTLLELKTSLLLTLVFAVLLCGVYPLAVWAGAQALFPDQANGSLDHGSPTAPSAAPRLLAQNFTQRQIFPAAPVRRRHRLRRHSFLRHQPRADQPETRRQHQGRRRRLSHRQRPRRRCARAGRRRHQLRQRTRSAHQRGQRPAPGRPRRPGPRPSARRTVRSARRKIHRRPRSGHLRRAQASTCSCSISPWINERNNRASDNRPCHLR